MTSSRARGFGASFSRQWMDGPSKAFLHRSSLRACGSLPFLFFFHSYMSYPHHRLYYYFPISFALHFFPYSSLLGCIPVATIPPAPASGSCRKQFIRPRARREDIFFALRAAVVNALSWSPGSGDGHRQLVFFGASETYGDGSED